MKLSAPIVRITLLSALALPAIATADPRTDYILHCRGCHGPDGAGVHDRIPDFRGQLGKFVGVPGGREYLIRVPGTSQSELNDARIAALLNWLLREFSPDQVPRSFATYTEAEVAHSRRPPLIDVAGVRRQLINEIAAQDRGSRQ